MTTNATITEDDEMNVNPAERQLFNLIQQINEQEPPHILQGRLKPNGDAQELLEELGKAQAEVTDASRRLIQIKVAIDVALASKRSAI